MVDAQEAPKGSQRWNLPIIRTFPLHDHFFRGRGGSIFGIVEGVLG